jgi:hypothetical protein
LEHQKEPAEHAEVATSTQADNAQPELDEANLLREYIRRRTTELQATGMPAGQAWQLAMLERRVQNWPADWGDKLQIVIYGDFEPPEANLHFPDLGIVIVAGRVENSIIRTATCVVRAWVSISDKSVAGLVEAAGRIDLLLGIYSAIGWGNSGSGWWCHVTHGSISGAGGTFQPDAMNRVISELGILQPDVRRKVASALHWIREPRQLVMEGYRSDILRRYAAYWNAFECLVDAVCILHPQRKLSRTEKQDGIDRYLADHHGKLSTSDVLELYQAFVSPGFVAKASHALQECFPDRSDKYVAECFKAKPDRDRLYDIRNAIDHGDVDAENREELFRIDARYTRLWFIVFGMLGQILSVPRPIDSDLF